MGSDRNATSFEFLRRRLVGSQARFLLISNIDPYKIAGVSQICKNFVVRENSYSFSQWHLLGAVRLPYFHNSAGFRGVP